MPSPAGGAVLSAASCRLPAVSSGDASCAFAGAVCCPWKRLQLLVLGFVAPLLPCNASQPLQTL